MLFDLPGWIDIVVQFLVAVLGFLLTILAIAVLWRLHRILGRHLDE